MLQLTANHGPEFSSSYNLRPNCRADTASKSSSVVSLLSSCVCMCIPPVIGSNVILPSSSLQVLQVKFHCISHLFHMRWMPSWPPPLWFDHSWGGKLWSPSCSFLWPLTCYLLDADILLSTLFSNTLNLWSSLNVRDQVSHPYKTTSKIAVLCIFNLYIFRYELGKSKILNWIISGILFI
jgi:hypothetical protein